MVILFVTSSSINGGAQKHIRDMFITLTTMGNEVHLVAPQGWLIDELHEYRDRITLMDASWKNVRKLSTIIDELSPDVINTFILSGGCFGVSAWNKIKKGKVFVTVNNPVVYDGISLAGRIIYPYLYKWLSKKATAFLVKSDAVAEEVKHVTKNRKPVLSIKNGIDFSVFDKTAQYEEFREKLNLGKDCLIVANVAVLNERKGQIHLIEATATLKEKYPIHLLLAGEGPAEQLLRERVKELDVCQNVHFLGRRSDINCILANADIFVLSSYHEGLPNALLEAMAMEKPCIATDVGGVRQLIDDGINGLVIEPKSTQGIESAIEYYITKPDCASKFARKAYEKIFQEYRQEQVANELKNIYGDY